MSVYDTARTCHEEREMGPCIYCWTGEDRQLPGVEMMIEQGCLGQVLGLSSSSMRHGYCQRC
jgi:hypothetical protein